MNKLWILAALSVVPMTMVMAQVTPTVPPTTAPATATAPARGGRGGGPAPVLTGDHPANSPIVAGAIPVKLADGFGFTEGATSDKDGNIFFVDQNNDKILEWEFDKTSDDPLKGKLITILHPSGYSNGMCFDNDGNLISCADEKNELWSIAFPLPKHADDPTVAFKPADLKITHVIKSYDLDAKKLNPDTGGKLMNGPNDVWVVPKGPAAGGMYLGDPLYTRTWWNGFRTNAMQMPGKYVWFLSADRKTMVPVVTDFVGRGGANGTPNGIIGTADGKTLYVSNIDAGQTFSYTIKDDGTLADKKMLFAAGSDGMTIDSDGNLYTTAGNARTGLTIWDKSGTKLDTIPIGCANCCFGGKNGDVLFICNNNAVYGVKMKTHRVGPQ